MPASLSIRGHYGRQFFTMARCDAPAAGSEHLPSNSPCDAGTLGDEGYMLLGLIVAIAILLLWLAVAATNEAFAIRRDREAETARRADQYVRAIRRYYIKFGHYPGSLEQLENTNNIRFLRRRWIDPLTGNTEWRTIPVGQNKTTPRGFFGEPLAGLPTSGLGALAGSLSAGMPGSPTAASGGPGVATAGAANPTGASPGAFGSAIAPSTSILGSPSSPATTPAAGAASAGVGGNTPATTSGATTPGTPTGAASPAGGSAFGSTGAGAVTGAFMGVGTNATGNSILEVNGESTYQAWEFLYDPRVEQLRQKQQLNSGVPTTGAGALGQSPTAGAFGQPATPGQPTAPDQPSAPGGFGQPFGSPAPASPGAPPPPSNPGSSPAPAPVLGGDTPLRP